MSKMLAGVDMRTQLAGHNRMELLLFKLSDGQEYGINVFKVQEVIQCPELTIVPNSHSIVRGVANLRGKSVTIMDIGAAIGLQPLESIENCFVIVTEYNRHIQGFLVRGVDRILNMNWEDILPPPEGIGSESYLTAVTHTNDGMLQIIDVEKVLSEVVPVAESVSRNIVRDAEEHIEKSDHAKPLALIADDSLVARNQVRSTVEQLGMDCVEAKNGREAFDQLKKWADSDPEILSRLALIISDIEMPEMDGYTFTKKVRNDSRFDSMYIILHTSLSGVFNHAMVEKVGANDFIPKFEPDVLGDAILSRLEVWAATD
ncbi:MAG: chemotaxis protein [Gammaproteobacteria bacterium]